MVSVGRTEVIGPICAVGTEVGAEAIGEEIVIIDEPLGTIVT